MKGQSANSTLRRVLGPRRPSVRQHLQTHHLACPCVVLIPVQPHWQRATSREMRSLPCSHWQYQAEEDSRHQRCRPLTCHQGERCLTHLRHCCCSWKPPYRRHCLRYFLRATKELPVPAKFPEMPWLEARCKGHAVAEALNDTKSPLETQWLRTKEKGPRKAIHQSDLAGLMHEATTTMSMCPIGLRGGGPALDN